MQGSNQEILNIINRSQTDAAAVQALQICEELGDTETKKRLVDAMISFDQFLDEMDEPLRLAEFFTNKVIKNDTMVIRKMLTESWAVPENLRIAMENLVIQFDLDVAAKKNAQNEAFVNIIYSDTPVTPYIPFAASHAHFGLKRGALGSNAEHQKVKQFYGAIN